MNDAYLWLKAVHIGSAMILFGTGLGTAFQMWFAHRSGDVRAIAVVARNVVLADWLFTVPSGIVQPISGFALSGLAGYELTSGWLIAAMALYVLAFVCWAPVAVLQIRMRDLAAKAVAASTPLPPAYWQAARRWFWLGWPAFVSMVTIVLLMVLKPSI